MASLISHFVPDETADRESTERPAMNALYGILLMSPDAATARAVNDVAELKEHAVLRGVQRHMHELAPAIERVQPAAVLVDIDSDPEPILRDLDSVIASNPDTRFIVLSSEQRSDLILQAMQAGVRHYMLKRDVAGELSTVLRRLVNGSATRASRQGSVITVLSPAGGCGATTIAINLANELQALTSQTPIIIDLDQHHGSVSGYLGLKAEYGVADVLSDDARIDGQLVRSTAVSFDDRLHVLASPATVNGEAPMPLAFESLGRMLHASRESYTFTIIDAPRLPLDAAAVLARGSVATLLPFEMNVEHIRLARVLHRALLQRNVPVDRIHPLANRYRSKHQMISLEEAQQAIGCAKLDRLCNDYKSAVGSINLGKTLSQFAPRCSLRAEIKSLAERIRTEAAAHKSAAHAE